VARGPLFAYPWSRQCGILNISQPYRPPRPVMGIALLYAVLNYLSTGTAFPLPLGAWFSAQCFYKKTLSYELVKVSFFFQYFVFHFIHYNVSAVLLVCAAYVCRRRPVWDCKNFLFSFPFLFTFIRCNNRSAPNVVQSLAFNDNLSYYYCTWNVL
jgi:hypothetical protein